jgi:hypothetical protein
LISRVQVEAGWRATDTPRRAAVEHSLLADVALTPGRGDRPLATGLLIRLSERCHRHTNDGARATPEVDSAVEATTTAIGVSPECRVD